MKTEYHKLRRSILNDSKEKTDEAMLQAFKDIIKERDERVYNKYVREDLIRASPKKIYESGIFGKQELIRI